MSKACHCRQFQFPLHPKPEPRSMFRFTIPDVLWLTVAVVTAYGCSRTLSGSAAGKHLIQELRAADRVTIKAHIEGREYDCKLTPDAKRRLIAWLQQAIRDNSPLKYSVSATIELPRSGDCLVLEISGAELGLRIDIDNYWRGLNRAEFERIIRDCPAND
jgi:hypothetical protein